jgi:hypothetical protein
VKRSKDLLADKLVAGTATKVSRAIGWWPAHGSDLAFCLAHADCPDEKRLQIAAAKDRGVAWDVMLKDPHRLMAQHVDIEVALLEATIRNDPNAIGRFERTLELNLLDQVAFHEKRLKRFPVPTFQRLMYDHIGLFLEGLTHLLGRDRPQLIRQGSKLSENAVRLGALLTEWI